MVSCTSETKSEVEFNPQAHTVALDSLPRRISSELEDGIPQIMPQRGPFSAIAILRCSPPGTLKFGFKYIF